MSLPIPFSVDGYARSNVTAEMEVPPPSDTMAPIDGEPDADAFGIDRDAGELLSLSGPAAAARACAMWKSTLPMLSEFHARWKVNEWRRAGYANVAVIKDQDVSRYKAWRLPGSGPDILPALNKAATLCRRMAAILFADPPSPLVVPSSGEAKDVDAAEFTRRVLEDVQGEHGLDSIAKARQAFDKFASQCGSGYVVYVPDPAGGGMVPVQIQASPEATHADNATAYDMQTGVDDDGQPIMTRVPYTSAPVSRYVREDGSLTDTPAEAARMWAAFPRSYVVGPQNLRFMPYTAHTIGDCLGVQVAMMLPYLDAYRLLPDAIDALSAEAREAWLAYRPEDWRELLPEHLRAVIGTLEQDKDNRLVFVLWTWYIQSAQYPEGCVHVALGPQATAMAERWSETASDGNVTPLMLPVAQFKHLAEGGIGHGSGLMNIVGPGQEMLAAQVGIILDFEERVRNRKTFLPTNSLLTPSQLRTGAAILPINAGGAPSYEEVVPVPREVFELLGVVDKAMEDMAGLPNGAASGMQSPEVQSGRLAYAIISQVHAGLSEFKQNVERGYTRMCRIELQELRRLVTKERQLRWSGEDGSYRLEAWTGAHLATSVDIRVKPGTMTMLTAPAKADMLDKLLASGSIVKEQYDELSTGLLGGSVGVEDDPFRLRIKGQVSAWMDDAPASATVEVDPTTGVVPDPAAAALFQPLEADTLPQVARLRLYELARAMSSRAYLAKPLSWRLPFDAEYARMRQLVFPPAPVVPPPANAPSAEPANAPGVTLPEQSTQFEAPPQGTPAPTLAPVPGGLR